MSSEFLYALIGIGLLSLGLYALIVHAHLLRKILAVNVMGSGIFLILAGLAKRTVSAPPDPVPHAMVITGIVVAVSFTAFALALMLRLVAATGKAELPDESSEQR